jgi:N utilization substance protein A
VIVDLGKFEAIMPNKERVQTEDYNIGDRCAPTSWPVEKARAARRSSSAAAIPISSAASSRSEVSEIADPHVDIKGIAREAGYRTKIAVWSANEKVDPVGACVGMRGARVKNIVRELNNEKVDIIRWSADREGSSCSKL